LELGQQVFTEAAKPIIDTYFPGLRYSAAMLGWSSEVLGYDDVESMDHNWGPRKFSYYPDDVWLYLLACQWKKIFDEEVFVGRAGYVGDELGSMSSPPASSRI
jgi:hypothetical protein